LGVNDILPLSPKILFLVTIPTHNNSDKRQPIKQRMSKVIWQHCFLVTQGKCIFTLHAHCTGQAHTPAADRMHYFIRSLQCASTFPLRSAPSRGGSGPPSNTWFLDPHESVRKWHHDRSSHFCTAYSCAQHTHSDHAMYNI